MKKTATTWIVLGVLITQAQAQETVRFKHPALLEKTTTLVPLREIAEWMGAQVEWQRPSVVITNGEKRVVLTVGSRTATTDGQSVTLAIPPKVIKGVTYVPLRFVGESLGLTVEFDEDAGEVAVYGATKTGRIVVHLAHPPRWWPRRTPPTLQNYRHATRDRCTGMSSGRCTYKGQCQGQKPDI